MSALAALAHVVHVVGPVTTRPDNQWDWATIAGIAAAVGTLVLASFTGWLAQETRNLARETADDISAEWRPVIVPAHKNLSLRMTGGEALGSIDAPIMNGGRGPALNIKSVCYSGTSVQTMRSGALNLGTLSVKEQRAVLGDGMLLRDTSGNSESWLSFYVVLFYEDLARRRYTSTLVYEVVQPGLITPPTQSGQATTLQVQMTSMQTDLLSKGELEMWLKAVPDGLWPVEHEPNKDPRQKPKPARVA